MLTITIPAREFFDERLGENGEFVTTEEYTLELEHSLISLSKWEAKWEVPFLGNKNYTNEQTIDYVRCMTITPDVPDEAYKYLTDGLVKKISAYIDAKMTATWFTDQGTSKKTNEIVTSELIYYWMVASNVPFEAQYWHLNRLMTLLRVISQKNNPGKKMSKAEILQRNRELNAQRKAQMGTAG